ncbi:tail fiber assembly protein [Salmonella enterica]|nr:tail fiber assembly protein [Salmonella enterica]
MNTYKFSARTNAFYPVAQQAIYEQAGTWPADAVDVDDSVYQEFAANITPVGKMRAAGDDGLPVWIDIPEPDPQLQSTRQTTLQLTLAAVALQCAVDAGGASDAQVAELATIKSEIARRFVTAQLWIDIPEPDPQL